MGLSKEELRKQIADLLFNIGYGLGDDHPVEAMVDGMHSGYSEYAAGQVTALLDLYSKQREVEAEIRILEECLDDFDLSTSATGEYKHLTRQNLEDSLHNFRANVQKVILFNKNLLAAPQPLSPEQRGKP